MSDDKRKGPTPGQRRGPYQNPNDAPGRDRRGEVERREKGEPKTPGRKPGGKNKQEPGSY